MSRELLRLVSCDRELTASPSLEIVPSYISPNPRAVMLMDGSKTMHAAALYKTEVKPPLLPETAENELKFNLTDDVWELRSDEKLLKK